MGFFSQKQAAPAAARASGAGRRGRSATDARMVSVPQPGFPEGDLGFIGIKHFELCGLSFVSFSSLPVVDHFHQVTRVAPAFLRSSANHAGAGLFSGQENTGIWVAWDSPRGSLLAVHCYPDGDSMFLIREINDPIAAAGSQIEWGIATVGEVPEPVAHILATGRPVPVWDLPGLGDLRPAPIEGARIPDLLQQRLNEAGWEQINETLFKAVATTPDDRSQVVFFGSWNSTHLACMSPVAHASNGQLPEILRGLSYEDYRLDVVADMVMLIRLMPVGPPSPALDTIMSEAIALAQFADRVEGDLSTSDEF